MRRSCFNEHGRKLIMTKRCFSQFAAIAVLALIFCSGCASNDSQSQVRELSVSSDQNLLRALLLDEPTTRPALASGVYNLKDLQVRTSDFGEQRPVFRSPTATLDELE